MRLRRKKRQFQKYIALLLTLTMSAVLCGCAKKAPKEQVTLSIWSAPGDVEMTEQMVAAFEAYHEGEADFHITVCQQDEDTCKDVVLFCPEVAADIYTMVDDQLQLLVDAGALLPISVGAEEVVESCGGADATAVLAASVEGTLYACPMTASNGYFLFYNADYLTKEDVESLDRILEVAEEKEKLFAMDFSSGWYLYSFFEAAGMDAHVNEAGTATVCDWNRTSGKYTGTDVGEALLAIAQHPGFRSLDNNGLVEALQQGEIIAAVSGTWNVKYFMESYGEGYRATKLPAYALAGDEVQMHSVAGYKLLGVNAHTQYPEWATLLAEWLTNEENQLTRFCERGEGPANVNASQTAQVQADLAIAALSAQSQYGHLQKVTGAYWQATYELGLTLISGTVDEEGLQELLDKTVAAITVE